MPARLGAPAFPGYAWRQALRLAPPAPHGALVTCGSRIKFFAESGDDESIPLASTDCSYVVGISLASTVVGKRAGA
ncbi:hypothetical protein GALL_397780 [mine drainage metagenome]|jgi:hypothetical protein|uniref:Uncharacterized protein n=1 Tax=mine drainage metagenome TaxID=410659 RepID=A0A1J5QLX6_9ZZZZ